MRIAAFSDVHGNPFACQAVLQAIEQEGDFEVIVAAGDLCLGGSDPARCIDMLCTRGVQAVHGNTDEFLFQPECEPRDDNHRKKWAQIQPAVYWTRSRLSPEQFNWLQALPFELRISPNGHPKDDLLVVHANPVDLELVILPPERVQKVLWGEIRQPDNDASLSRTLRATTAQTIAFGHFHYSSERILEDKRLVNVASCSLPGIDHDRRARYTTFTWHGNAWEAEPRWVAYDAQAEIDAIQASDLPSKAFFIGYFG
jgi:predicted phosphodiesterase